MWGGISVATFHVVDVAYGCAKSNYFRELNLANHVSHFECGISYATACNAAGVPRGGKERRQEETSVRRTRLTNKNR